MLCVKKIRIYKRKIILSRNLDSQCEKLLGWSGKWVKKLVTGKRFNWKIHVKNNCSL